MSVLVENLTKVYGSQKAVNNISFKAEPGSIVGFLGPNGAGKTTTMKILTTYIPQTSGVAQVCGYDVLENPMEVARNVGYLPENNPLYPEMYVKEYLQFIAGLHKLGKSTKNRVAEMVERTGLEREQHKKIAQLSKGYKQRVGIAQAMIHNPKVLILDEPTSGLDPNQLMEIRKVIKELGKEKTVILSSHIMQEVEAVCDRVMIINKGEMVANDLTKNLQKITSQKSYTVQFDGKIDLKVLKNVEWVVSVEDLGDNRFTLQSNSDKDTRKLIFDFAVSQKTAMLALEEHASSLEEVFKKLTNK
ncbi:MAG: ABC-2 type transport system ATP-binding protein [Sphingobacteriales bacterium]